MRRFVCFEKSVTWSVTDLFSFLFQSKRNKKYIGEEKYKKRWKWKGIYILFWLRKDNCTEKVKRHVPVVAEMVWDYASENEWKKE